MINCDLAAGHAREHCHALLGESVVRVTWETTGEVLAHIAVGHVLSTIEQHLGAVIKLWYAIDGKQ